MRISDWSSDVCSSDLDGLKAVENAQVMRRALAYAKTFGLLIVQHPEEPSLAGGAMNGGELATRLGLPGLPRLAEVMMIERDLRLVEIPGGRDHVAQDRQRGA